MPPYEELAAKQGAYLPVTADLARRGMSLPTFTAMTSGDAAAGRASDRQRGISTPLRVVIDARLIAGTSGGIETVVRGLAEGFDSSPLPTWTSGSLPMTVTPTGSAASLVTSSALVRTAPPSSVERLVTEARGALRIGGHRVGVRVPDVLTVPADPVMRSLGAEVVHYPFQRLALPDAPFLFHPHDLQHVHLPQYFFGGRAGAA